MKNYGSAEALDLLCEAVDIAAHGEAWHHKHMLWAQSRGLQGHKRLNRYESAHDRAQCIRLQNYCLDMFGETVEPSGGYVVYTSADIKGYLEAYLDWENSVYTRLGDIISRLESMGCPCEAEEVRRGLNHKEIKRVRRMLTEYGLSGWDMPFILLKDKKIHDKMKKKEKG